MTLEKTDWSLVHSFLSVAETGSLSGAAAQLGHSQPTLGRHIKMLEQQLGADLFHRHARGLSVTETGAALVPLARTMRETMNAIALAAGGQTERIEGTVRITASVFASHFVLPPIIAKIREAEPAIKLVLIPDDDTNNLLFREADIAVRMYRSDQLDIVTRHVTDLRMSVYAATSYLARRGRPKQLADVLDHDLIGFDTNDLIVRTMRDAGWQISREDFVVRCDNQATYWELLRAGCGIGFSQRNVGQADPLVEELTFDLEMPILPVWLAAHEALRQTPRLRRVWDLLAQHLQSLGMRDA
jgi:DNA-binding transcriptional LysR family regulator